MKKERKPARSLSELSAIASDVAPKNTLPGCIPCNPTGYSNEFPKVSWWLQPLYSFHCSSEISKSSDQLYKNFLLHFALFNNKPMAIAFQLSLPLDLYLKLQSTEPADHSVPHYKHWQHVFRLDCITSWLQIIVSWIALSCRIRKLLASAQLNQH